MSFYGGITGGINQTNKTLTSIVTVSDGFVTISGGNINNVNSLDVNNLEVGNLTVDTQATFNNVIGNISSYNIINSNVYNGNIGNINLITSNIINSGNANINNINANQAVVNDLFLSNINVQNGNVSGNLFLNNINSYSGSVNIFSDLYVYGNISYTYSNIVRYTDRNLELNYGGTNTSAIGGGISIMGTSNAILGNIYLDSLNNWNLTSTTNQVNLGNLSSSNINNSGLLNSGSAIIGGTQSYALYLNRSAGVANIGCEIRNNGLGNTIIQPIQQGTSYRNTLLNPYGGVVTIGTLTPINNNELLYVQGTGNIINLISNNGNITNINNNLLTSNIIDVGNGTIDNIINTNLKSSNIQIGDNPFNLQTGTRFYVRNTSVMDSNIRGSISGNVYHQMAMAGRNWVYSQDGADDGLLYFGCQGGGDPDPDFDYFYKRGVGLQIQPNPNIITTDFNSALSVLGNVYISKELNSNSNINCSNINSSNIFSNNANINNFISDTANITNIISNNANITNIISNSANISNISSSNIDVENINVNNKLFCAERIISDRMVSRSSAIGHLNVNDIKCSFMSFVNQGLFRIEHGTTNTVNSSITITFQKPFNNPPTVLVSAFNNSATPPIAYIRGVTNINADLYAKNDAGANYGNLKFTWLAIGF